MNQMAKTDLVFTTVISPGSTLETNALALVESIRKFGGALANNPIWVMSLENGEKLSQTVLNRLAALNVQIFPFINELEKPDFFFADQITALSNVERFAIANASLIVWLDANTLVLQEPREFLLSEAIQLGYRPVHHRHIGSLFNEPPDDFWSLIYDACQVPSNRIFPMKPVVEECLIRPYFNAGLLVVRPEFGLFRAWYEKFVEIYQHPAFLNFFERDRRYPIFMHQAVLVGIILSRLKHSASIELSSDYNYPMDLYNQDQTRNKPARLDELVTIRHENFFQDSSWHKKIPAAMPLIEWINEVLRRNPIRSI